MKALNVMYRKDVTVIDFSSPINQLHQYGQIFDLVEGSDDREA